MTKQDEPKDNKDPKDPKDPTDNQEIKEPLEFSPKAYILHAETGYLGLEFTGNVNGNL